MNSKKKEECFIHKWRNEFGCMSPVHMGNNKRWEKYDKYIIEDMELKLETEFDKNLLEKLLNENIMDLFLNQNVFTRDEIDELVRIDIFFDVPRVALIVENNVTDVLVRFISSKYSNMKHFCTNYKNSVFFSIDYKKLLFCCYQPIQDSNDYSYLHFLDNIQKLKWKSHAMEAAVYFKSVDLLNILLDNYKCPLTHWVFVEAAEVGYIPVLEWLLQKECPWNHLVFPNAAKFDNINTLNWLLKNKCPCDKDLFYFYRDLYTSRVKNWLRCNLHNIHCLI